MNTEKPIDTARCPLCGGTNQCALSTDPDADECWCATLEFPEELLAQIPQEAVRKTCICKKCLAEYQESANGDEVS
jgi:hypothetical protein